MIKKKTEKKVIRTCPVCNSINIVPFIGFRLGWQYECKECSYIGALTKEVEVSVPQKS